MKTTMRRGLTARESIVMDGIEIVVTLIMNARIVPKCFLHIEALFTTDASVNDHNSILAPEKTAHLRGQVGQRVPMFSEDHQLLLW